jgi:hypothetical protein
MDLDHDSHLHYRALREPQSRRRRLCDLPTLVKR